MGGDDYFPFNDFSEKMKIKIGIVLLLALLGTIWFFDKNQSQNDFLIFDKKIKIGDAYASSSINVPIFRQNAMLKTLAGIFLAYYDGDGYVRVALIKEDGKVLSFNIKNKIPKNLMGDGHCAISMGHTNDNYIHLI